MPTQIERSDPIADEVDPPLAAGDTVGEWSVAGLLGSGGSGRVYEAVHATVAKRAAVKVLGRRASLDPKAVARFTAEARVVNEIGHPNIVQVFGFGSLPDGRHYYAMDLVAGGTLERVLGERGALSREEALPILRGVASALDAAHDKGIAHRDVKPDNVLLDAGADGAVAPRLVDFGLAKLVHAEASADARTETGSIVGTPAYMAPEQSRGGDVDARADVYSFGVLAYRVVTGRLPFTGADPIEILMKHRCETPRAPSRLRAGLPAGMDAALLALLDKRPERRPARLAEAVEGLAQAWSARPPRSRTWLVVAAAALALALVVVGAAALREPDRHPPAVQSPRPRGELWHAAKRDSLPTASSPSTAEPAPMPALPPRHARSRAAPPRGPEEIEDPYR